MAITKNALIRYKTIDKCLKNHYRKWTLNDLIEACSDALYDFEDRDINVSKRTIQLDIQLMRSDKLGYNAPIEVYDKKFYRYADENYSIANIPLTENDMNILSETMQMLKQFEDFSLFSEFKGVLHKLEDKLNSEKNHQPSIIHLDKNIALKGLEWLDELYQAILKKVVLKVMYQSFKAMYPSEINFHPHLLKEFNNRWFLIGKSSNNQQVLTLALDRILSVDYDFKTDYIPAVFDTETYYKDTIGVTVLDERSLTDIMLKVDSNNAPYVKTKPFHSSQQIVEEHKDGSITFKLRVHQNFEFERLLLGFGEALEVLSPKKLRRRIAYKLKNAVKNYEQKTSTTFSDN